MKTITVTISNRPQYLRRLLATLKRNILDGYDLYFAVEPNCDESLKLIKDSNLKCNIIENTELLGVRDNPFNLLSVVFEKGSEFNIYLEEDLILSPDAIDLSNHYFNIRKYGHEVICYSLFNYNSFNDPYRLIESYEETNALGFCLTDKQWQNYYKPYWYDNELGWDYSILDTQKKLKLKKIYPALSRTNHIGDIGVHAREDFCKKKFHNLLIANERYFHV